MGLCRLEFAETAHAVEPGSWTPLYIGRTDSLEKQLADGEKERCAKRKGATYLHVHTNQGGAGTRTAEAADLIAQWNPVCNDRSEPRSGKGATQVKP